MNLEERIIAATNEYQRLNRQLESKTQQLEAMLAAGGVAGDFPVDFKGAVPRCYTLQATFQTSDLDLLPVEDPIPPQEVNFIVDRGTVFHVAAMSNHVKTIGFAEDGFSEEDVAVQATLPWDQRLSYFDFLWSLRDTGTDREWCDRPQPSLFGGGGYVGPFYFPRRTVLSGGTTVFGLFQPTVMAAGGGFGIGTVQEYVATIVLYGHQVPDNSSP